MESSNGEYKRQYLILVPRESISTRPLKYVSFPAFDNEEVLGIVIYYKSKIKKSLL
jgi:hypothetical protein